MCRHTYSDSTCECFHILFFFINFVFQTLCDVQACCPTCRKVFTDCYKELETKDAEILPPADVVRPDILNEEDICKMVPLLRRFPGLTRGLMHWLILDKCNKVHSTYCYTTGEPFAHLLIDKAFRIRKHVYNEEVLDRFKGQPFITVSNHPMGAMDGILLIDIIGRHYPEFKVMVNMFLYHISAMRPSFIPVDPESSDNAQKKMVTLHGIRTAMKQVRDGHPIGFFPAGAVSKIDRTLHISDRKWQPSLIRLIQQMKLPVVPVYFHEHNSAFFNILGMIDWRLRTLRLPRELFNKTGQDLHVTIGEPVTVEEQLRCQSVDELGDMLRNRTYALKEEGERHFKK